MANNSMYTSDTLGPVLIVEDLMLVLLDDRSGAIPAAGVLPYLLGGAALAELALAGRVEVLKSGMLGGRKLHATEGKAPEDAILADAWAKIAERPSGLQSALLHVGGNLREPVLQRLIERGFIREEKKKALGIFPMTKHPIDDGSHEKALMERLRGVLVDGLTPDDSTRLVIALLSAGNVMHSLDPQIPWSSAVYRRGKEAEKGEWSAEAVSLAVAGITAAIAAASTAAVTASIAASGSS